MTLPRKEDYERFLENFGEEVSREHPSICFYIYGSLANGTCNYGRSDIDGGLILDSDIVTSKDEVLNLARIFARNLDGTSLEAHLNLMDRESNRDGRFLSYTTDYTDWIKKRGKIVAGPDLVSEMDGLNYKSGVLHAAAFNFRRVRNFLLELFHNLKRDAWEFEKSAKKAVEVTSAFPKKLLWLRGFDIISRREDAGRELSAIIDNVDFDFLSRMNSLLKEPQRFYETIWGGAALSVLIDCCNVMEQMVASYIHYFPTLTDREARQ